VITAKTLLPFLCLGGCAMTAGVSGTHKDDLAALLDLLPGSYTGEVTSPGPRQGAIVRHRLAPSKAPQFGDRVIYYQLDAPGSGQVLQQKLFVFSSDAGAIRMQPWVFPPGNGAADLDRRPGLWPGLRSEDLSGFPEACSFLWTRHAGGFDGRVEKSACEFESRAFRRKIRPDMLYRLTKEWLEWSETLYDEDGDVVVSTNGVIISYRDRAAGGRGSR